MPEVQEHRIRRHATKDAAKQATAILLLLAATHANAANLALNKQPVVSSVERPAYGAKFSTDALMTTRWSSAFLDANGQPLPEANADDQRWRVDLGAMYYLDRVVIKWEAAYGKAYQIRVSDQDTAYTTVFYEQAGNGGTDEVTFARVQARWVMIRLIDRATAYGYSFWEVEVPEASQIPAPVAAGQGVPWGAPRFRWSVWLGGAKELRMGCVSATGTGYLGTEVPPPMLIVQPPVVEKKYNVGEFGPGRYRCDASQMDMAGSTPEGTVPGSKSVGSSNSVEFVIPTPFSFKVE